MPRLTPKVCRKYGKAIRLLLPANNGVLDDARAELRWIIAEQGDNILSACRRRYKFEPLQYILKYQSFGPLSIQCKKNVLIPRWETEEWTSKLANRLTPMLGSTKQIKIVDICTGSGCIALLLACLLPKETASIQGVDISPDAISLAQRNKADNRNWLANEVEFSIGDLFSECISTTINLADVIVSNPPYVSAEDQQSISLSTRRFEPKIALIAENGGDAFYVRILDLLEKQCQAKWLVLEVGSQLQANRVEGMMLQRGWRTEIWRDGAGVQRCVMGRRSLIPG